MIKSENNMLTFIVYAGVVLLTMFVAVGGLDIPKEFKMYAMYAIAVETVIYLLIFFVMNHESKTENHHNETDYM